MNIAIIGDTHVKNRLDRLRRFLEENIQGFDLIIHVGDILSEEALDLIESFNNTVAVYGNNDKDPIRKRILEKEILNIENYKIGVFHGSGKEKTTMERSYDAFLGEDMDIILFGHSHSPLIKTHKGVLMINPGSPTHKRRERLYSFAVLNINKENIEATIKFFS